MRYLLPVLLLAALSGCTLQSALSLKCDGKCSLEADRAVDTTEMMKGNTK